jgi:hypothetical protein
LTILWAYHTLSYSRVQPSIQVFQASRILKLLAPHLDIPANEVFVEPNYPDRHQDFQGIIHPDNIVEALRMALINLSLKCGCHRDVHNCNQTPSMMCVLVISRFVLVNDVPSRASVISYSRKSISSYGRIRSSPVSRLIKDVITFYLHEDNLSRRLTPPPLPLPTSHSPRDVYSGPLIPRTLPLDRNLFSSPFILQRQTHWDRCRGIVVEGSL